MKQLGTGRAEISFLCVLAMLLGLINFAISSEASAKPRTDRTERQPKAWGKSKKSDTNSAPTLAGTPDTMVLEGTFYDFEPVADDANGDALSFTIVNKPGWADFDPTSGALYGTPRAEDVGRYDAIVIAVSDGKASDSLPEFAIDVTSTALGSVTLNWQPPTENTDGTALTDLAGYRIYYGVDPDNFSDVIELTNASLTSCVVDNLAPDTWYFVATSVNSSGVESSPSSSVSYYVN